MAILSNTVTARTKARRGKSAVRGATTVGKWKHSPGDVRAVAARLLNARVGRAGYSRLLTLTELATGDELLNLTQHLSQQELGTAKESSGLVLGPSLGLKAHFYAHLAHF